MSCIIDFEREFFNIAKNLESKSEVRSVFLARINELAEDWINDKLRWDIAGLKDEEE
jgi:hypothetical protein